MGIGIGVGGRGGSRVIPIYFIDGKLGSWEEAIKLSVGCHGIGTIDDLHGDGCGQATYLWDEMR